jgi:hypothetical protein
VLESLSELNKPQQQHSRELLGSIWDDYKSDCHCVPMEWACKVNPDLEQYWLLPDWYWDYWTRTSWWNSWKDPISGNFTCEPKYWEITQEETRKEATKQTALNQLSEKANEAGNWVWKQVAWALNAGWWALANTFLEQLTSQALQMATQFGMWMLADKIWEAIGWWLWWNILWSLTAWSLGSLAGWVNGFVNWWWILSWFGNFLSPQNLGNYFNILK